MKMSALFVGPHQNLGNRRGLMSAPPPSDSTEHSAASFVYIAPRSSTTSWTNLNVHTQEQELTHDIIDARVMMPQLHCELPHFVHGDLGSAAEHSTIDDTASGVKTDCKDVFRARARNCPKRREATPRK